MKTSHFFFTLAAVLAPSLAFAADTTPTVTTQTRYARGATMAFFRITTKANGSQIKERGIVYAKHNTPTVEDSICRNTISFEGGNAYWLKNLDPSTCYYARAYAKDANGNVGYGDVRRFYTLPKGKISYTLRSDGDEAIRTRLKNACDKITGLWNDLTSIWGFYPNVGYNSGTPTADCSYGGYTRVGPTVSYQAPGTILHEWLHGVGVGTISEWYNNADMRSNTTSGYWLGERTTDIVRFIQNNETAQLNGDGTHMWPYGINGAHEDTGTDALYVSGSLVCQALGEDGLPPSSSMGFATPYDAFDCEDGQKYYLRSEDEGHGLYTAFLTEQANGTLKWVTMSNAEATANDSAAWTFSYDPVSCYYSIKNAATGHNIVYSGGQFKATTASASTTTARIQLLRGRVEAIEGSGFHGYFLAYNQHNMQSPVLAASDNGATTTGQFSFSNSATSNRWLILTAAEIGQMEGVGLQAVREKVEKLIAKIEALLDVPHTESVDGTDDALRSAIADMRSEMATATEASEIEALETKAYSAMVSFLRNVTANSEDEPFELTFLLSNPEVSTTADGWSQSPTISYSCGEFYEKTFDFNQTIHRDLPKGAYQVNVQAFQRPGTTAGSYTAWAAKPTSSPVTTELYALRATGSVVNSTKVMNIWDNAQTTKVGIGTESTQNSLYVPNNMEAAGAYFDKDLYDNSYSLTLYSDIKASVGLKVGIRCTSYRSSYWSIFRNFRLYYYGSKRIAAGITAPSSANAQKTFTVYGINGQVVRSNATNLDGLAHGIYIVNGKKVVK